MEHPDCGLPKLKLLSTIQVESLPLDQGSNQKKILQSQSPGRQKDSSPT